MMYSLIEDLEDKLNDLYTKQGSLNQILIQTENDLQEVERSITYLECRIEELKGGFE